MICINGMNVKKIGEGGVEAVLLLHGMTPEQSIVFKVKGIKRNSLLTAWKGIKV